MRGASVLIVGAGLFGRIIGHTLARAGHNVLWVDDDRDGSGFKAAGCIVRPSWLAALGSEGETAINHLKGLYPTEDRTFYAGQITGSGLEANVRATVLPITAMEIDPKKKTALSISKVEGKRYWLTTVAPNKPTGPTEAAADFVIVAAGIWTQQIVSGVALTGLYGTSAVFEKSDREAGIVQYAPYKQEVWFPRSDGFWYGDGQALIKKSYNGRRAAQTVERANRSGLKGIIKTNVGVRPYSSLKTGVLEFRPDNLIVSTGGAKNGSAVAALHALEIERFIEKA